VDESSSMLDEPVKRPRRCRLGHHVAGAAGTYSTRPHAAWHVRNAMNDPASAPLDLDRLARRFVRFADTECRDEPLYDVLCRVAAQTPALLALLQAAPPEQRRPNLLLAAVHDLVLAGSAHPLASYFPSAGGAAPPDTALPAQLLGFCAQHDAGLRERITTRTTQTNEIGRCAVLWPVLQHLAALTGSRRFALLDVGCSAGLNLGVDAYRYAHGPLRLGAPAQTGVPCIDCTPVGDGRPDAHAPVPQIVARLGIDPAPIDVADERAVRWLRACLWPHDALRRERFDQAVQLARQHRWPVRREADCTAAAQHWAEAVPADVLPVIFNSWVLTYFEPAALARHVTTLRDLVQRRGAAWISAEEPRLRIGDEVVPPLPDDADAERRRATLWTLMRPGKARAQATVLARSHPHGKWLEWLAAPA